MARVNEDMVNESNARSRKGSLFFFHSRKELVCLFRWAVITERDLPVWFVYAGLRQTF